jgi:hypothetical protein
MRKAVIIIALALATAGCSLPDLLRRVERFFLRPPKPGPTYCIVSLEPGSATGITASEAGGNAMHMACDPPLQPNNRPSREQS